MLPVLKLIKPTMFRTLSLLLLKSSTLAKLNLHGELLLTNVTSFSLEATTLTVTKPTPCFITSGKVSECRRKRGTKERPHIDYSDIEPYGVTRVDVTLAPQLVSPLGVGSIASSFDDSYSTSLFRQMELDSRDNVDSVGDCGLSSVNFSQFLSCLGLSAQKTTTLRATLTLTQTLSTGYASLIVLGHSPAAFPYVSCPASNITDGSTVSTDDTVVMRNLTLNPVTPEDPTDPPCLSRH